MENEKLLKFLSRAINQEEPPAECPSAEEMAAFIDQRLSQEERNILMEHFTLCDLCSETLSQTLNNEEVWHQPTQKKRIKTYSFLPYAVAATLIVIVGFNWIGQQGLNEIKTFFIGEESLPPTADTIIQKLSQQKGPTALARYVEAPSSASFGFSSGFVKAKTSFQSGVHLIDLKIVLKAGDHQKALALLNSYKAIFNPALPELEAFSKELLEDLNQGKPLDELSAKLKRMESFFQFRDDFLYFRLGEWVEGGRLAALIQDSSFFEQREAQYFLKILHEKENFPNVVAELEKITQILQQKNFEEKTFKQLSKAFRQIKALL